MPALHGDGEGEAALLLFSNKNENERRDKGRYHYMWGQKRRSDIRNKAVKSSFSMITHLQDPEKN
jgi:hypothetical protein